MHVRARVHCAGVAYVKRGIWEAGALITALLHEKGAVRARDLRAREFSANWLVLCTWECTKIAPGVYGKPRTMMDSIAVQATKYPRLVLGMTTALWMHGIIERPVNDRWLIGARDRVPGWFSPNARFHRSRWAHAGVDDRTFQRVPVRVQSPLWAALSCVRFRRAIGISTAREAVGRTIASGHVTRAELFDAARECHLAGPLAELLASSESPGAGIRNSPTGIQGVLGDSALGDSALGGSALGGSGSGVSPGGHESSRKVPRLEPQLRNGVEIGNPQLMKFTVRTPEGELTFGSFGEVEKAWLLGLVGPDDELLEEGNSKWRKASTFPHLVNARRTGDQAWGGAWFLWTVIGILMGSGALWELKAGIAALSHGDLTPELVIGAVLGLITALVMIRVTVRAHKNSRPHG
jgi:hypothetical protein